MKNTRATFTGSNCGGFTLLELLAAVAILAIISTLLFGAFSQSSKAWLQAEARVETHQQIRAVLDMFSRELSQAIVSANFPKMSITGGSDWISFVAPVGDINANTELLGVKYGSVANGMTFVLCRNTGAFTGGAQAPSISLDPTQHALAENLITVSFFNTINGTTWTAGAVPSAGRNPRAIKLILTAIDSRAAARLAAGGDAQTILSATNRFSTEVYLPSH
jgi:prepilin-type N-terminal cleavage/methylation domain-containing protein